MAFRRPRQWLDEAASLGRFTTPETAGEVRRLAAAGRDEEALDALEDGVDGGQDARFWLQLLHVARHLGDAERATSFSVRHLDSSGQRELDDLIEGVIRSGCSLADGMRRVVAHCARTRPHPGWERFNALPVDRDLLRMQRWLEESLALRPPPGHIDGLRFGLVHLERRGALTMDMYLSGTRRDPHDAGWPLGPASWDPGDASAASEVLDLISRRSLGVADAEHVLCLAYGALAVRSLATAIDGRLVRGGRGEWVLAVGYEGDGVVLGTVGRDGFRLAPSRVDSVEVRSINKPVAALVADLIGPDAGRRHKASLALGRTHPSDGDAVPGLVVAVGNADARVRFWAATALLGIGPGAAGAVPALVGLMADPEPGVRQVAAEAVAAIGVPAATEALPALVALLRSDPEPTVRANAALALGDLAEACPEAVEHLTSALGDPDRKVRHQAAVALRGARVARSQRTAEVAARGRY